LAYKWRSLPWLEKSVVLPDCLHVGREEKTPCIIPVGLQIEIFASLSQWDPFHRSPGAGAAQTPPPPAW